MGLQIRRLSYSLGAEIIGIDVRDPLDDKTFSEIYAAFLSHCVLLFRGQPLTRKHHVELARRFGEVDRNEGLLNIRDPEYPEIIVNKLALNTKPTTLKEIHHAAEYWHTDQPHRISPPMATMLRSVEIPELGGDTMFSNMYLAYEALSDGMKKLIDGLHGIHPGGTRRIDDSTPQRLAETRRLNPPVAQPLVRVHPETGRKAIFLTSRVKQFVGMTAEESEPLIQFLCKHSERPQFVYRHRWQKHDLLVWDNRCLLHNAVGDYDRAKVRHMERTTIKGAPSGYAYEGPL